MRIFTSPHFWQGVREGMCRAYIVATIIALMALLALPGCATGSGQQGQGETRVVIVHGAYFEAGAVTVSGGGKYPTSFFNSFSHTGDSDATLQPSATGTVTASPTNAPTVEADISGIPGT